MIGNKIEEFARVTKAIGDRFEIQMERRASIFLGLLI